MSDLQWCPTCDKAIQAYSNSLYCSIECLRADSLNHHPMLGYDFAEFKDFPRRTSTTPSLITLSPALSTTSTMSSVSPTLSPLPSTYALYQPQQSSHHHNHQQHHHHNHHHHHHQPTTTASNYPFSTSLSEDVLHLDSTHNKSNGSSNATLVAQPKSNASLFFI